MLSCLVLQLAAVLEGAAASFGDFNATAAAVAVGESVVARVEGGAFGNPAVLTLGDSRWRVKMAGVRAFQTDYSQAEFVWRSNNWGSCMGWRRADFGRLEYIDVVGKSLVGRGNYFDYVADMGVLGLGVNVRPNMSVGLLYAALQERTAGIRAAGMLASLGWRMDWRSIRIAMVMDNIMESKMWWFTRSARKDSIAAHRTLAFLWKGGRWGVHSVDVKKYTGGKTEWRVGSAWWLASDLCIRAGLKNSDRHLGLGLNLKGVHVDLAWVHRPEALFGDRFYVSVELAAYSSGS